MKVKIISIIVVVIVFGVLAFIFWSGRNMSAPSINTAPSPAQESNFVLIILNSSSKKPSVDISIYIDDDLKLSDAFKSTGSGGISLPPHQRLELRLSEGVHTIRAVSKVGETNLSKNFEIEGKLWGLIGYAFFHEGDGADREGKFDFYVQKTPILFQ